MLKCFCEEPMTLEPSAEQWYATSCGHIFHYVCLINWLERSETCPQCREPVRAGQIIRLFPAASEDIPEDDVNETLQDCLNHTLSQLEEMTKLCKKKDAVIARLKVDVNNKKNFRRENEALKSLLQTFDGETLDKLFDDPNHFNEVLKGKMALIKLDEGSRVTEGVGVTQETVEASETDATVTPPRTESPNASASDSTLDEESVAIEYSLEAIRNMLTQMSEI